MNLEALYELRDRLEDSAIAGLGLLGEDFRLKRAVDKIEAYTNINPVFKQIYSMSLKLLEGGKDGSEAASQLLDTLALLDALLCTQGSLYTQDEKDSIVEIDTSLNSGEVFKQLPYSRLKPVIEAFSSQGGGRYAVISEAYKNEPEIFEDFRMKYWLIYALGDSYSEISQLAEEWLKKEDKSVCPLLKRGFDAKGKKEMARRVEIIASLAKNQENDFYRSLIEDDEASKEVREAAIYALGAEPENEEFLIGLVKTERGKCREAALSSLSCMEGEGAIKAWKQALSKKPEALSELLFNSTQSWVGELLAQAIKSRLEKLENYKNPIKEALDKEAAEEKKKDINALENLWCASRGKAVQEIAECALRAYRFIPETVNNVLKISLLMNPDEVFFSTAKRLFEQHKDACLENVFCADLLTLSANTVYERYEEYFNKSIVNNVIAFKHNETGILNSFLRLRYDEKRKCYILGNMNFYSYGQKLERVIFENLDIRWYDVLLNYKKVDKYKGDWIRYTNSYDEVIALLYNPEYEELKAKYGSYFYKRISQRQPTPEDIRMLKRCGWKDYRGILSSLNVSKNSRTATSYYVKSLLKELPLEPQELAAELDILLEKGKGVYTSYRAAWREWSEKLKSNYKIDDVLNL